MIKLQKREKYKERKQKLSWILEIILKKK